MPLHLPLADVSDSPAVAWQRFVAGRDAAADRSQLAACSGCDDCGIRCLEGIAVTRGEYEEAEAYFGGLPDQIRSRIESEEKTVAWPGAEDTGATMTWCRYRDQAKGNCSIYTVRPTVCRLFGHASWLPCPTGAVTSTLPESDAVWRTYTTFERRTWAEWDDIQGVGARAATSF